MQLVKERIARLLVDAGHLDCQPSLIEIRRERLVGRFAQRRRLWASRRILRRGQRFRSLVGFGLLVRVAVTARVWASRAGDGGWSGSREGQRRPVALRPPVDGGLVGSRGDLLPAVATLSRAATPYGARIADAAGGGLVWERRGGVVSKSGVG
jgi:hypothetical protein